MTYSLGPKSLAQLDTAHPRLRGVVQRAIKLTTQDFMVGQGVRTVAEAKANLAKGTSATTRSLHLMQPDGYAHAVDLWAWVDGAVSWEAPLYYPIAVAMRSAALDMGVTLRWGGQWARNLNSLTPDVRAEHDIYMATFKKAQGRYPLVDLPHFELPRGTPITTESKA